MRPYGTSTLYILALCLASPGAASHPHLWQHHDIPPPSPTSLSYDGTGHIWKPQRPCLTQPIFWLRDRPCSPSILLLNGSTSFHNKIQSSPLREKAGAARGIQTSSWTARVFLPTADFAGTPSLGRIRAQWHRRDWKHSRRSQRRSKLLNNSIVSCSCNLARSVRHLVSNRQVHR